MKNNRPTFAVVDVEWNIIRKGFKTSEEAYEWIAIYGDGECCVIKQW